MKEILWLHLRALQVISLSIVTQEENILFQIPHTSILVITHTFLWRTRSISRAHFGDAKFSYR